jgi:hypothetical protein
VAVCIALHGADHVRLKGFQRRKFDDVADAGLGGCGEGVGFQVGKVGAVHQDERLGGAGERACQRVGAGQVAG